jgi:hypothetical protein
MLQRAIAGMLSSCDSSGGGSATEMINAGRSALRMIMTGALAMATTTTTGTITTMGGRPGAPPWPG